MNDTNKILFSEPDLDDITTVYTAVDMHVHTRYSDGLGTIPELVEKARQLNIGLAVTDHNEIQGAVEINAYDDVLSIPGIEVTTKEGSHLLSYFYDIYELKHFYKDRIAPFMGNDVMTAVDKEMEDIIENALEHNGIVILPHPYSAAYTGIDNINFPEERRANIFSMIHGVEAINAGNLNRWNLKCALLGFNLNKVITGGSDAHSVNHIGRAVSYAECEKEKGAFLNALLDRENKVIGKEIDFFDQVTCNSHKIRTGLKNCPDVIEKNVRYSFSLINTKSKQIKENVKKNINVRLRKMRALNSFSAK